MIFWVLISLDMEELIKKMDLIQIIMNLTMFMILKNISHLLIELSHLSDYKGIHKLFLW
jgi:hypothetical protein